MEATVQRKGLKLWPPLGSLVLYERRLLGQVRCRVGSIARRRRGKRTGASPTPSMVPATEAMTERPAVHADGTGRETLAEWKPYSPLECLVQGASLAIVVKYGSTETVFSTSLSSDTSTVSRSVVPCQADSE